METPRHLNPNPSFSSAEVSSTHMSEPFTWLAALSIDSVTIDDYRMVSVDHVEHRQDGTMHVICSTEEGSSHLFSYNPLEDGPVAHLLLEQ